MKQLARRLTLLRLTCAIMLLMGYTSAQAVVIWVDVNPDLVIDASGPGGGQYSIPNPYGGPNVVLTLDAAGLTMAAESMVNAALPIVGTDQIDYQICDQELNAASNWQLTANDPTPSAGEYFAGFIFREIVGLDEHYSWIHFTVDPVAMTLTIIEYAYQNSPGLPIDVCAGSPTATTPDAEICGNGIDDDGDGNIDFADDDCPCILGVTTEVGLVDLVELGSYCTEDQLLSATPNFTADSYSWYHDGVVIAGQEMATLDIEMLTLGEGTYTTLAQGETGCASDALLVIEDDLNDVISLDPSLTVCGDEAQLHGYLNDPTIPITLAWSTLDGTIVSGGDDFSPTVAGSGTYTMTATLGPCSESENIVVDFAAFDPPVIAFDIEQTLTCDGTEVAIIDRSTSGSAIASYDWDVDGVGLYSTADVSFVSRTAEDIEVSLLITDDQGCSSDSLTLFTTIVHQPPLAQFGYSVTNDGLEVTFVDFSETGGAYERHWDFGDDSFSSDSVLAHLYGLGGEYDVTLSITDSLNCSDISVRTIELEDPLTIFIPSAFTPDGDGINDRWAWTLLGVDDVELSIYDRYGRVLFFSDDINGSWGGGEQVSEYYSADGIYTYVLKARKAGQGWVKRQGVITLLR